MLSVETGPLFAPNLSSVAQRKAQKISGQSDSMWFVMFLISRVQMPSLGWHFVQTMAPAWLPLWQSFQAVLQLVAQPSVMTCNVFSLQIPNCAREVLQNRQASNWDHMPEFLQRQLWDFAASWVSIPRYHDIPCIQGHQMPSLRFQFEIWRSYANIARSHFEVAQQQPKGCGSGSSWSFLWKTWTCHHPNPPKQLQANKYCSAADFPQPEAPTKAQVLGQTKTEMSGMTALVAQGTDSPAASCKEKPWKVWLWHRNMSIHILNIRCLFSHRTFSNTAKTAQFQGCLAELPDLHTWTKSSRNDNVNIREDMKSSPQWWHLMSFRSPSIYDHYEHLEETSQNEQLQVVNRNSTILPEVHVLEVDW